MIVIPFQPSIANYRMSVPIDGTVYTLDVHWNGRDSAWYFDVSTVEDVLLYAGIKIVLGARLGIQCQRADFPLGYFVALDSSGAGIDAGFDDIGTRVQVVFAPYLETLE
jgi:hypothetical protein